MATTFFNYVLAPEQLIKLWKANAMLLVLTFVLTVATPFLKSSVLEYPNIKPLPFDGTVSPIAYVPNWLDAKYSNKSLRYEDIPVTDFVKIPAYDAQTLLNDSPTDKIARLSRFTYITPYMGSYRMNFEEFDGSHLGVDIRAPLGTPVVSIANGVVVRVKTTENADGKYVVIRHDNVSYQGQIGTFYSSYLHLESVAATEGTVIKKGETLGKVGLTGITTTPHLHFQVDRDTAAFHPYWPYSFSDLKEANIDFFEAVNVGFGKENAMKHTVHPLDFVQTLENETVSSVQIADVKVASSVSAKEVPVQNIIPAVILSAPKNGAKTQDALNSAPALPAESTVNPIKQTITVKEPSIPSGQSFADIKKNSPYYAATAFLKSSDIVSGYGDGTFQPGKTMTRSEAAIMVARTFNIDPAYF